MNYIEVQQMRKQAADPIYERYLNPSGTGLTGPSFGDQLVAAGNALPDSYNFKMRVPPFGTKATVPMDFLGRLFDYRDKPSPRWYNTPVTKTKRTIGQFQRGLDRFINNIYDRNTPSGGLPRPPEYDKFRQTMEAKKLQNSMPKSHYGNRMTEEDREINSLRMPNNAY